MIRFGLLAAATARIVLGLCEAMPFTLQVSHWSATPSNWTIAAIVAPALFGFYASRAGQPLFGDLVRLCHIIGFPKESASDLN